MTNKCIFIPDEDENKLVKAAIKLLKGDKAGATIEVVTYFLRPTIVR